MILITWQIFDMEEFKCQMAIQMKIQNDDDTILRHQSVTCLSLVKDGIEAGDTPCWLLVINLCALRAIKDPIGNTCILEELLIIIWIKVCKEYKHI